MKHTAAIAIISLSTFGSLAQAQEPSMTTGPADVIHPGLLDCAPLGGRPSRISAVGTIASDDGQVWTVPADTQFQTAPKATDLYNECTGVTPEGMADIDLSVVPIIDAGGHEEFTAYIFADNYFELYVNGRLLAVDPVPFVPFNSNVIRFKADRPVTLAVKMVDWEENLGLGSEANARSPFHAGDGGFVAHIQDAAGKTVLLSNDDWRAQTFYTAPLKDMSCLKVEGALRDSTACDTSDVADGSGFSAAHWPIPPAWMTAEFDDGAWPRATTFTNETVGVANKPAYTNFAEVFDTPGADAEFIWSSNLILDNVVLLRRTID
ncbi:hypothetical protein Q8W25_14835 [Shimia thalassica]|uniref:hypothetical protein n=1 Tax=Shimia thalassica TaxID=1715693 RepID=UPI0027343074|nr:hypothetical protein [Shimia thalassica]MDP2495303.1 hypothetical protein [Shimia thalassica]